MHYRAPDTCRILFCTKLPQFLRKTQSTVSDTLNFVIQLALVKIILLSICQILLLDPVKWHSVAGVQSLCMCTQTAHAQFWMGMHMDCTPVLQAIHQKSTHMCRICAKKIRLERLCFMFCCLGISVSKLYYGVHNMSSLLYSVRARSW
jgi:hypothetical protein